MKSTFQNVINEKQYEKIEERKDVFNIILLRTMMQTNEVKKNLETNELSEDDFNYVINQFEIQLNE